MGRDAWRRLGHFIVGGRVARGRRGAGALAGALLLLAACGAPRAAAPSVPGATQAPNAASSQPARTLNMAGRVEPAYLTQKPLQTRGISLMTTVRLFNAYLAYVDEKGAPHPYLAQDLPQLNTPSWQVEPDGRMTTTWKLKPNVTWHDGAPLQADDFVFAWQVYASPTFGTAGSPPQNQIDLVEAPDPLTVVMHWKQPYPDAGVLWDNDGLPPLPRHILGATFEQDKDAVINSSYWNRSYVGLGPYKLTSWETGAYLEGTAFDGHVMGKPKIERIRVQFIGDPNSMIAALLAGTVDIAVDDSLRFEQGSTLKQAWGDTGGEVLLNANNLRYTQFQLRPEVISPRVTLDVRVRKALAYSLDKQALNEGIFQGQGVLADTPITNVLDYYPDIDRAITKYPYDLRQSEQLMADAGFTKGSDGFYALRGGGHVQPDLQVIATGTQNAKEQAIMVDGWKRAGFDVTSSLLAQELQQDGQSRASFPSMATQSGNFPVVSALVVMNSANIGRPENHWAGSNRGAWTNQDYDRLIDQWATTLDVPTRNQQVVQLTKILSEELPLIPLYYNFEAEAHAAALTGPLLNNPAGTAAWNVADWELR